MKTRLMTILALLALASMASSGIGLRYNADISATQANSSITFTDNGSGGSGQMFNAKYVLVRSLSASANTCYYDLKDKTATTADTALEPGGSISEGFPGSSVGSGDTGVVDGYPGMGIICSTGQTATFRVTAVR